MHFGFDSEDGNPETQKEVAFELDLTVSKVLVFLVLILSARFCTREESTKF